MAQVTLGANSALTSLVQTMVDGRLNVAGGTLSTKQNADLVLRIGNTEVTFDSRKWRDVTGADVIQGPFSPFKLVQLRTALRNADPSNQSAK